MKFIERCLAACTAATGDFGPACVERSVVFVRSAHFLFLTISGRSWQMFGINSIGEWGPRFAIFVSKINVKIT